jgi:hypothetical protein
MSTHGDETTPIFAGTDVIPTDIQKSPHEARTMSAEAFPRGSGGDEHGFVIQLAPCRTDDEIPRRSGPNGLESHSSNGS